MARKTRALSQSMTLIPVQVCIAQMQKYGYAAQVVLHNMFCMDAVERSPSSPGAWPLVTVAFGYAGGAMANRFGAPAVYAAGIPAFVAASTLYPAAAPAPDRTGIPSHSRQPPAHQLC